MRELINLDSRRSLILDTSACLSLGTYPELYYFTEPLMSLRVRLSVLFFALLLLV